MSILLIKFTLDISTSDASFMLISLFVILGVFLIIGIVGIIHNHKVQSSKPVERKIATVIDKNIYNNISEWCIIQFDNGERLRLRNPDPNRIFVAKGDRGYLEYQGQTIISFEHIS